MRGFRDAPLKPVAGVAEAIDAIEAAGARDLRRKLGHVSTRCA